METDTEQIECKIHLCPKLVCTKLHGNSEDLHIAPSNYYTDSGITINTNIIFHDLMFIQYIVIQREPDFFCQISHSLRAVFDKTSLFSVYSEVVNHLDAYIKWQNA